MTLATEPPASAPQTSTPLPEQVSDHMQTHFPEDIDAGGWICARDYRDDTAVVVWRPCRDSDELLPGGARAVLIYRWHVSLQNKGFISVPRTDMEVFGRPDAQAPDGRARWLHITGWDPALAVGPRSFGDLDRELRRKIGVAPVHQVLLDPGSVPKLPRFMSGEMAPVHGLDFQYRDGGVDVRVVFRDEAEPLNRPPGWVLAVAEEHRLHGEGWDGDGWCRVGRSA